MADQSKATAVLIHGSWHQSWCWERVVPILDQRGCRAETVDLPSCGANTSTLADLSGDATTIANLLDRLEGPTIVVAHSYGGAPATAVAAEHGQVQRILYLSAFMLDVDESCASIVGGSLPTWCQVHEDGSFMIDPKAAPAVLYGDCDPQTQQRAIARLVPQLTATSAQTISLAAWRTIPSTYVVCTIDRAISPEIQRHLAERATDKIEIHSSHSPFFSHPEWVAALISQSSSLENR